MAHSFYKTHLADHEIKPLSDLLEVEGANGQVVPYLGYTEINLTLPREFLGSEIEVDTLALVIPDNNKHSHPLLLIGTNAMDIAYGKSLETDGTYLPTVSGYRGIFKILQHRHVQSSGDHPAYVTLHSIHPQTILPGTTAVLCLLHGGLIVKACLIDLPQRRPCHLPVVATSQHILSLQRSAQSRQYSVKSIASENNLQSYQLLSCHSTLGTHL